MSGPAGLAALEQVIGSSGVAARIEVLLPAGVRPRQLSVRALLAGMCLTQADGRPAHLNRVRQALVSLPGEDQRRLGIVTDWKRGPHLLTYRQVERTSGLVADALAKDEPDELPSAALQQPAMTCSKPASPRSTRTPARHWRWTGPIRRPSPGPRRRGPATAPTPSIWGYRKNNLLRCEDELFTAITSPSIMMPNLTACSPGVRPPHHPLVVPPGPVPVLVPVLTALPAAGTSRSAQHTRRLRLRSPHPRELGRATARSRCSKLIQDLHPSDRGPHGTHHGAIISNGNLYRPVAPRQLLRGRAAGPRRHPRAGRVARHTRTAELARYKLGKITTDDADGYHRVMCPAVMGKIPLPAPPSVHDPGPGPARDPHPAAGPARLAAPSRP